MRVVAVFDDGVLQANEIRGGLLNGWRTWEERNKHCCSAALRVSNRCATFPALIRKRGRYAPCVATSLHSRQWDPHAENAKRRLPTLLAAGLPPCAP